MTTEAAATDDQLRRALSSLRDMRQRLEQVQHDQHEPIAIVGMGCRLPGATDPQQYWELLRAGVDAITETPAERWDVDGMFDPAPETPGTVATKWGGFLDDIDRFDAGFFGISPREAAQMDPQQRLLLEVAWETLEDGGRTVDELAGSDTGVFVGVHSHSADYYLLQTAERRSLDLYSGTGTSHSVVSGRLSYLFDLRGPSIAVDTACSSSLVAVHLAVRALRNRECSLALAGGVNAIIEPTFTMVASRMRMMSPTGRCRPFDAGGDGFVRSEGCAAVLLKRLSDAVADGDRVLAVIRGSAVNQDGRSNGLTAPNSLSQQVVIRDALTDAGVNADAIGLIEAHGTGTPLGDPIEIEALAEVFGDRAGGTCLLGSAKANIGHCEGAAGVAGLIKAVLSVRTGEVPPLVHFAELNPHISLDDTPFVIPTEPARWSGGDGPRLAGVSSFGWSGTNAHLIVGEAPASAEIGDPDDEPDDDSRADALVLPISARSAEALRELAVAYRELIGGDPQPSVAAVCANAALRRSHHEHRLAVVGHDRDAVIEHLDAFIAGEESRGLSTGRADPNRSGLLVFVCPGQGSQWRGMARRLIEQEPVFRAAIDECEQAISRHADWRLSEQLAEGSSAGRTIDDIDVIQPTLFAIQVALAALWRSRGVHPDAVVGHSMGEVAAAHIAGILGLDDAARIICVRSALLRRISGEGAMAVVGLDAGQASEAIAGRERRLSVAVSNSETSTVLSGDPAALQQVMAELEARDVFCRSVNVDVASHSPQVDALLAELVAGVDTIAPQASTAAFLSTVTAEFADGVDLGARYWSDNLRRPVRFAEAVARLIETGHSRYVELSPHPVLLTAVRESLQAADVAGSAIASLHRDSDEWLDMWSGYGALYADGHRLDWTLVHPTPPPAVDLPRYPWQRERYWLELPSGEGSGRRGRRVDPLLGWVVPVADEHAAVVWENELERHELPALYDHRIGGRPSVPASALVEMMLRAAATRDATGVGDVRFEQLLLLDDDEPTRVQVVVDPAAGAAGTVAVFAWRDAGWVRHATAALRPAIEDPTAGVADGGGASAVSAEDVYASLAVAGVELGPTLRSIGEVRDDGVRAVAAITARGPVDDELVALDACLQSAAIVALRSVQGSDDGSEALRMPVSASAINLLGPTTAEMTCVVRRGAGASDPSEPSWTLDVALFDDAGRPVVRIDDLVLQRLDVAADRPDDWFYGVEWVPSETSPSVAREPAAWIVLADRGGVGDALAEQLRATGASCRSVHRSDVARDVSTELRRTLAAVASPAEGVGVEIVHLWGLDGPSEDPREASELAVAQELGCAALVELLGAVADSERQARITVVTAGVQRVTADDPAAAVAQAPLWGLGRAVADELPDLWGGLIDLDPAVTTGDAARALADELLIGRGSTPEPEVALRAGQRHVSRLARITVEAAAAPPIRHDASYLVTGGFGAIGGAVARWLVRQGARRIVLIGRTELPPRSEWSALDPETPEGRRAEAVRRLERDGAAVHVASLDIADERAVRAFLDEYRAEGWPPVRGVFHTAAVFGGQLLDQLDTAALLDQLMPKVIGAWTLGDALDDLDHFVLFSSIASLLPVPGQGAYAAGNAFLDALAQRRHAAGRPALSVNWGFWDGSSEYLAGEVGQRRHADDPGYKDAARVLAESRGMRGFRTEQGLAALGRLMSEGRAQAVVVPVDWQMFRDATRTRPIALVADLAEEGAAIADGGGDGGRASTLAELLEAAPVDERPEIAESTVRRLVGSVLKMPESRIDATTPFGSLGLDSLMAIELRNALEVEVGLKLSATMAWNYPTVVDLRDYVLMRLGAGGSAADLDDAGSADAERDGAGSADVDDLAAAVAALDDDAALRALMGTEDA